MIRRPPRSTLFPYTTLFRSNLLTFARKGSAERVPVDLNDVIRRTLSLTAYDLKLKDIRSEEHTSELQSPCNLVCRLLLEKKKKKHRSQAAQSTAHYATTADK